MPEPGRLIVLDGIDGAGKTSCVAHVRALLTDVGIRSIAIREPGGTALGENLRALLFDERQLPMVADAELLLIFAARAELIQKEVLPALNRGCWVVSDRFTDATYAYQGGGRGIASSRIEALERWVQGDLKPDLSLIFDLPVDVGLMRKKMMSSADQTDRIGNESKAFFERVRATYLARAQADTRSQIIDANQSADAVQAAVQQHIAQLLQHHRPAAS